ncbi:hypothetical protein A6M14_09185 [Acinetobacter sp. Ac_877]|uniref:RsiV family protein n=1 Tax=Acinetobacter portensis TaxID=1839785 RepID=UPI00128B4C3B|nr:RsiV family protein [Acinetobacter portensis]MPW41642.1 hypothetical protein [Acinetobacter portensis]
MQSSQFKVIGLVTAMMLVGGISGCKPVNEPVVDEKAPKTESVATAIPTILSKVVTVELPNAEACSVEGCTQYSVQTVETNIDWINDYFLDRIHKADPVAFTEKPTEKIVFNDNANVGLSQSTTTVRYISQFGYIATFAIDSYSYNAGAAHGMYHTEYVNFDLKNKKRLALEDIVMKDAQPKILNALYDANSIWLENHVIERAKFQLSDNFYYGVNGLVFVYPLYELASYAEGMSELTLPYRSAKALFKPEFMPSLPKYANQ